MRGHWGRLGLEVENGLGGMKPGEQRGLSWRGEGLLGMEG